VAALFLNSAIRKRIDRVAALQRARWRAEAGLLHLFWAICAALRPRAASAFGRRFLKAIGPHLGKSAHIRRNLMLAFPALDESARESLLRAVWGNAGAVLGEYPHFKAICHDDFDGHFEFVEKWNLDDLRAGRRHGVFVTAHVGNWELAGATAGRQGIPIAVIYAPSRNPLIDRLLRRRREALGCTLVSLDEGARPLMRELGEGRSVGLVVDARDDDGHPIPFFGLDKWTTLAPARLALRFGCDLIPVRVERLGDARFRLTVYEPVRPDPALASDKDRAIQMMGQVNRLFESWIREQPEQWLCTKRAWPKALEPTDVRAALTEAAKPGALPAATVAPKLRRSEPAPSR
jgi:Kdo2-lipid IVA lauroyltransferase/acyltransferase